MEGVEPGTHYLKVNVTVSDSVFEVINMPSVSVRVTDRRPTETEPAGTEPSTDAPDIPEEPENP